MAKGTKARETHITGVGDNDRLPYTKADVVKMSRVNNSYSLSFYQHDYQAIANFLIDARPGDLSKEHVIPVAKIVMDEEGFKSFAAEFSNLLKMLEMSGAGTPEASEAIEPAEKSK